MFLVASDIISWVCQEFSGIDSPAHTLIAAAVQAYRTRVPVSFS